MNLNIEPNIADPDAFYERLIELHNGLEYDASVLLNTRLVAALRERVHDAEALQQSDTLASRADDEAERDARLILLLANHIGGECCLEELLVPAHRGAGGAEPPNHAVKACSLSEAA